MRTNRTMPNREGLADPCRDLPLSSDTRAQANTRESQEHSTTGTVLNVCSFFNRRGSAKSGKLLSRRTFARSPAMDDDDLRVPLEGFEDVTPIPQDDGPDPVVSIAYKHNCEWTPKTFLWKALYCAHMVICRLH